MFRAVGDANTLKAQGDIAPGAGDDARGLDLPESTRDIYGEVGDRVGIANFGIDLARSVAAEGDLARAIACLQSALNFARAIGHPAAEWEARIKAWRRQLAKSRRKGRQA